MSSNRATEQPDIGRDFFVASWPQWLRWLLCLPAGLLGTAVVPVVAGILTDMVLNGFSQTFWGRTLASVIGGFCFVYFSALVAPRRQIEVSVIALVLYSIVSGDLLLYASEHGSAYGGTFWVYMLAGICSGLVATFSVLANGRE
jgi:hypothetical protein